MGDDQLVRLSGSGVMLLEHFVGVGAAGQRVTKPSSDDQKRLNSDLCLRLTLFKKNMAPAGCVWQTLYVS